jgi:hypothetical protein
MWFFSFGVRSALHNGRFVGHSERQRRIVSPAPKTLVFAHKTIANRNVSSPFPDDFVNILLVHMLRGSASLRFRGREGFTSGFSGFSVDQQGFIFLFGT